MTRLHNEPAEFVDEMIDGFVAAHRSRVMRIPGGVVRRYVSEEPTVALVIGGGSGHYPAFAGLVGPGLAHGAAMGNIFASPSAQQVYSVAKSCDQGRGVLLSYGNYAGDVLNFDAAQDRLRAEGHDVRTVVVTDDIASAEADERAKRRGIAGDLTVFKVAGAATEAGMNMDEVERLARHANDRTRSLGVAFSGCTLPGAEEPLFTVPEGRMAVGLGIHGEPGVEEVAVPSAHALAELFVTSLLEEIPPGLTVKGARVVPLLNGLGSVKSEELFLLYGAVAGLLEERGVMIVEPEVGELCTSFDMAGCSLTLLWLDDELEELWSAPTDSPGYRKGSLLFSAGGAAPAASPLPDTDHAPMAGPQVTGSSRSTARLVVTIFDEIAAAIDDHTDELGRMDAIAGDGDHGIGMQRGTAAAREAAYAAAEGGHGAGSTVAAAADAWGDRAGGTSGALWAVMLQALGAEIGDVTAPSPAIIATGVARARDAVISAGKARLGDKTMIDAIMPFANEFGKQVVAGASQRACWVHAAQAATRAAQETASLTASLGRARTHGEKSLGTPDPGAVSFALICTTVAAALNDLKEN